MYFSSLNLSLNSYQLRVRAISKNADWPCNSTLYTFPFTELFQKPFTSKSLNPTYVSETNKLKFCNNWQSYSRRDED
jgi:hypothetical protein